MGVPWLIPTHVQLPALRTGQEVLFLSDLHLGYQVVVTERERERRWIQLMQAHRFCLAALFLVGDIFDCWVEDWHVIPKGFVRLQVYLMGLVEEGIPVHFISGNHEFLGDYFATELGLQIHRKPISVSIGDVQLYIAHGHGLACYKLPLLLVNSVISNILRLLHPLSRRMMLHVRRGKWKKYSKYKAGAVLSQEAYVKKKNAMLIAYATSLMQKQVPYKYYLFGHTHAAYKTALGKGAYYVNLGDGIHSPSYGILDDKGALSIYMMGKYPKAIY